jgi:hypothetical protein
VGLGAVIIFAATVFCVGLVVVFGSTFDVVALAAVFGACLDAGLFVLGAGGGVATIISVVVAAMAGEFVADSFLDASGAVTDALLVSF